MLRQSHQQQEHVSCNCWCAAGGGSGDDDDGGAAATMPARASSPAATAPTTTLDESDMILAKEMSELSVKEREQVLDEIHGVAEVQEETPEFIAKCIAELDLALTKLAKTKRRAWDRATFLKPQLVKDVKFKLMFLRADLYDGVKAAKRMAQYFEQKLLLFGEAKLAKTLTLDDLEKEDLELLNIMGCVILPHRDQTGRPIWFFDISRYNFDRLESLFRCFWYQLITTAEDETAQLKGVCDVAYCPGDILKVPPELSKFSGLLRRSDDMARALPCRVTSFHFCYDDVRLQYILKMVRMGYGKEIRLRMRAHFGSDLEIQYSLMTFGISCNALFRSANANNDDGRKAIQEQHIVRRREIETRESQEVQKQEAESGIILHPAPKDVLIGRGRPYQEFPGNQRFGNLIDTRLEVYRNCGDRFGKTCITMDVVKTVQEYGGRFIERKEDALLPGWRVIDDIVAREKTAISFRSRLSKTPPLPSLDNTNKAGSSSSSKSSRPLSDSSGVPPNQAKRFRHDN